jgi:uncharacterized protein YxeA
VSIENFLYTWKKDSYDEIQCVARDADGNPTHVQFFRKEKLILEIFIKYDSNGDWLMMWSKIPKEEKPKKAGQK